MNLAELKSAWTQYDRKLQSANTINDHIISELVKTKSLSRMSWIEKLYNISFVCNILWIILSVIVLITNPFDFTHGWQHIPFVFLTVSLVVLLSISIMSYRKIKSVDINRSNVDNALKKIIYAFEKPWQYLKWNIVAIFSSACLLPFSFLPIHIQALGLWPALSLLFVSVAVVAFAGLISARLGVFNERYGSKFKQDLEELSELRAMSTELMKD